MSIAEEIEQLKSQLALTDNEEAEAELLIEVIEKYASIQNKDSKHHAHRLLELAEKINSPRYKAHGLHHLAFITRLNSEYDVSINLSEQALLLFEELRDKKYSAEVLTNIGKIHYQRGNFDDAVKIHTQALQIREEAGDKGGIAASHNNLAIMQVQQGNYVEALKRFIQNLEIQEELADLPSMAFTHNNIGVIYAALGNYPEALKNHLRSLAIRNELGDKTGIALSYSNIGVIYYDQGNYADALKNYFLSLKMREEIGDKAGLSGSYNNIGTAQHKLGNYEEALKNYLQSLQIKEEIGDKWSIASSYNNLGTIYLEQGNYAQALENHLKALEIGIAIGDKREMAACYIAIGSVYEKQNNHSEAEKNKLLAFEISEQLGNSDFIKHSSLSLYHLYKDAGDFENALKYHEKLHQIESEMLGEQAQKQITNLSFMHNLEQKEKNLEIEQLRNVDLKRERDRSENLLLNILPAEVAEELKEKGTADAKLFENVTVLFTDFKGFTTVGERLSPQQLVDELHTCFSAFDGIMEKYSIEKIKTVGDAYLAVAGLPLANANHAENLIRAAIEIREFMQARRTDLLEKTFEIRIGVHSGSVVAGIVGVKKFAYDIWGDTVNTAARMEQNSVAGKINISQSTYELVKHKFNCEYRGEIEAKNKGKLKMYFVN